MADCFDLPNAAKLVENLRTAAKICDRTNFGCQFRKTLIPSADAIEQLIKERDAAVADIKGAASFPCRLCKKEHTEGCDCYTAYDKWEWRGVQEGER